jgi:FkbM family methyltransferase
MYSITMANICRRTSGYVRAFEPVPTNLDRLQSQIELNQLGEGLIHVEKIALSDEPGSAKMDLCDGASPGNAKITGGGQVSVEVKRLDQVWKNRDCEDVDFMKIDTEGWDAKIIAGGAELIRHCRPNMLIEFNRERMTNHDIPIEPAWQMLVDGLEYRVFRLDESSGRPIEISVPDDHENLFFVRTEDVDRIQL